MVSGFSIAAIVFSISLSVLLPIAACIYFKIRHKINFVPMITGIIVFIAFSLILESILNNVLLFAIPQTSAFFSGNVWLYAAYGGLAAGVFEETGRFTAFFFLLKKYRDWKDGVAYGIGHGGIEAILLGGLANVNYLIYAVMINSGTYDSAMSSSLSTSVAAQLKESIISTFPALFAVSGLERVFAFMLQIALSLLVLYGVKNRKYIFLLYAVLIHAAVDFPAALYQKGVLNIWVVEGILAVVAVLSVIFIIKSKKLFNSDGAASIPAEQ